MEEDIKILRNTLSRYCYKNCKGEIDGECDECKRFQAIENLINRVKELEEAVNNFMQGKAYSTKQLEKLKNNFIQKSKMRENIEKHKKIKELLGIEYKTTKYEDEGKRIRDFYMVVSEDLIIQSLEELLEDK